MQTAGAFCEHCGKSMHINSTGVEPAFEAGLQMNHPALRAANKGLTAYRVRGFGDVDHVRIRLIWNEAACSSLIISCGASTRLFEDVTQGQNVEIDVSRSMGHLLAVATCSDRQEVYGWNIARPLQTEGHVVVGGAATHRGNITIESEVSDLPLCVKVKDAADIYGDIKLVANQSNKGQLEELPYSWHSVTRGNTSLFCGGRAIRRIIMVGGSSFTIGRGSSMDCIWTVVLKTASGAVIALDKFGNLMDHDLRNTGCGLYYPLSRVHASVRRAGATEYFDLADGCAGKSSKQGVFVNDVLVDEGWCSLKAPCSFSLGPTDYPYHAAIKVEPYRYSSGGSVLAMRLTNHSSDDLLVWAKPGCEIGILPFLQTMFPVFEGSHCPLKFKYESGQWSGEFGGSKASPVGSDSIQYGHQKVQLRDMDKKIAVIQLS